MIHTQRNNSNISHHFEVEQVLEPNYRQFQALESDHEFQRHINKMSIAKISVGYAKERNRDRFNVKKKRTLGIMGLILTPIAVSLISIAAAAMMATGVLGVALLGLFVVVPIAFTVGWFGFFGSAYMTFSSFCSKRDTAILKGSSLEILTAKEEVFSSLQLEMKQKIEAKFPHVTESELKSLEKHFLKQL